MSLHPLSWPDSVRSSEPASELEWLGFELALRRYFLAHEAQSAILAKLVRQAGITLRIDDLADACQIAVPSVKVYASNLREAMRDLGFGCRIEYVRDGGYRLSESGAGEVWRRVMAVVFHLPEVAAPLVRREVA